MDAANPIDLLFGGMDQLAPGDDAITRQVLRSLPDDDFQVVVDAGCGSGRQTLVLAAELHKRVHAVDTYAPFLDHVNRRAQIAGLAHLVQTHCMDMAAIPQVFPRIDLLWSEGAAYTIGFANALETWRPAIFPGGYLALSELTWLVDSPPPKARAFFSTEYPAMQTDAQNLQTIEAAGYRLLSSLTLPRQAWVTGYYAVLAPRAQALLEHPSQDVRQYAREMLREIEVFEQDNESYAYVFYVLQRP